MEAPFAAPEACDPPLPPLDVDKFFRPTPLAVATFVVPGVSLVFPAAFAAPLEVLLVLVTGGGSTSLTGEMTLTRPIGETLLGGRTGVMLWIVEVNEEMLPTLPGSLTVGLDGTD